MKKFKPLQDRILVSAWRRKRRRRAASSSRIPPKRSPEGEVIAVGPGKVTEDGSSSHVVKVGDKISSGSTRGARSKLGDEELLIMREEDVLGNPA